MSIRIHSITRVETSSQVRSSRLVHLVAHGAHESRAMSAFQREYGKKVGAVERHMHVAVHHHTARLDIGRLMRPSDVSNTSP
jgi:hypothetical protein